MYDRQIALHHCRACCAREGPIAVNTSLTLPFAKRTQSDPFCIALTASVTDLSAVAVNGKSYAST